MYYRLHVIPIHLPPLRERQDDIHALTEHFIKKISKEVNMPHLKIEAGVVDKLRTYNWPGNVREFENVLERAAVLCDDAYILASDLPLFSEGAQTLTYSQPDGLNLNRTLETTEKQLLEKAMDKAHGVKTEAAKLLDIKTSALYYKLEKYGLL